MQLYPREPNESKENNKNNNNNKVDIVQIQFSYAQIVNGKNKTKSVGTSKSVYFFRLSFTIHFVLQ